MVSTRAPHARRASTTDRSTSPRGPCRRRSSSVASFRRIQAGSAAASESSTAAAPANAGTREPVDQVEPQLPVVEAVQEVVAEDVRVGGHGHAAAAVGHGGEQDGAGGRRLRPGAQHGGAGRHGERAGAVEAHVGDAVQQTGVRRLSGAGARHPGRGAGRPGVVEDGACSRPRCRTAPGARRDWRRTSSPRSRRAPAGRRRSSHEALDGGPLRRREDRRAAERALPLGLRRVGDDEHVGLGEDFLA